MSPRFSIIMPALNAAGTIGEAIASVRSQTLGDWELIVVDDGSNDATRDVAEGLALSDGRIRLAGHAGGVNRGAAASRNLGIERAGGAIVGFLDADDLYEPDALAIIDAIFAAHPRIGAAYGFTRWFWEDGSRPPYDERPGVQTDCVHAPPELAQRILLGQEGDIPCTCSFFARLGCVVDVGGFETRFALYEDQSLWAKLFLQQETYVTSRVLSQYRQSASSASAAAVREGTYARFGENPAQREFFEWFDGLIRTQAAPNPALAAAMAKRLEPYRHPLRSALRDLARRAKARIRTSLAGGRQPGAS